MLTPEQSRAARGLLDWPQSRLADEAKIARQTVVDFERGVRDPTDRSLESMLQTFKDHRVEFVPPDGGGDTVRLLPAIWKLTPKDPESLNWKASIYCGELIVRATSERRARQIATLALAIAVRRSPHHPLIVNPWGRIIGEVTCERVLGSEFSEDGSEAILFPNEYDREWRH